MAPGAEYRRGLPGPGRLLAATGLLAAMGLGPQPAAAGTLAVPADQPTVRAAAQAAANGDTILVAPGVHGGGVYVNGKALTVASWYAVTGDTAYIAQTVLQGVAGDPCSGQSGCSGNAILEYGTSAHGSAIVGLTVTGAENGVASASIVSIDHCRIVGNGDGVDYVQGAGGIFSNSLFAHNSDDGIDLNGKIGITIVNNDIRDNADDGIEHRLWGYTGAPLTIAIVGNRITGNGEDGIQLIDYPNPSPAEIYIERNLFMSNFNAWGSSAAIGCMDDTETIEDLRGAPIAERIYVIHNTFVGEKNGVVGGANVIALNNLFVGTQGSALRRVGGNSIVSYSLFWDNAVHHEQSNLDTAHLVYTDPMLAPDGTLPLGSPAIDAGITFFQWQDETVLDLPPGAFTGAAPDLGAFEFGGGVPPPVNMAPAVDAGSPRTIAPSADAAEVGSPPVVSMRAHVLLNGTVIDDGRPSPPALVARWSAISGPGPVVIESPGSVDTYASFASPGLYRLRLTASDGALSASDSVEITVLPVANAAPVTNAGQDRTVTLPAPVVLRGTAIDDDHPRPPALTVLWTLVSGPGPVALESPNAAETRVTFTIAGTYVLRLTGSDGALSASDTVTITVRPPPLERPVAADSDDAEEDDNGRIVKNDPDLDLVWHTGNQTVGLRFTGVDVPPGATITRAYVQFEAHDTQSGATSLLLWGQASDDPGTFTESKNDLTNRPRTTASVAWSPPPWTSVGEAGAAQRTPELVSIVQEIVDRPGWSGGNALVIFVTGTGHRTARSHDLSPAGAPLLHVEYVGGGTPPALMRSAPGRDEALARDEAPARDDAPAFSGIRVIPSPSRGELSVEFGLTEAGAATVELHDVSGRRLATRALGRAGPGLHRVRLGTGLPAGLYLVRVNQGGMSRVGKAVVVD